MKVFSCSCCPPNVLRVYGSLQEFLYSQEEDGLTVHMFAASEAATKRGIIRQETDYPRENTVRILPPAGQYTLRVRIPAWCKNTRFTLNMSALTPPVTDGYAALERCWQEGDTLEILFDMPVRALCANPLVSADAGRVCLMKGPVVYCLESADNGSDLADLWLQMPLEARCEEGKHCGLPVITAKGSRAEDCKDLPLYSDRPYARKACEMRFIPFYAWANRGENEMTVWVHTGT